MEAVVMKSSGDYKHRIGNPKRNFNGNSSLVSYSSDNLILTSFLAGRFYAGGGLPIMPPSPLSNSYPPSVSLFRSPQNHQHRSQQPPLLPLPISMPSNSNIRLSPPATNKKIKNRSRDHSLTPKKSKNQKKDSKKEEGDRDLLPPATMKNKETPPTVKPSVGASINQMIGPDPKDLQKDVTISRVFSSSINKSGDVISVDKFSGSVVFTPSPPPSSLPLPTFSLRPKLSCKAEAAAAASGIDAGATDSLRRLLRLRIFVRKHKEERRKESSLRN